MRFHPLAQRSGFLRALGRLFSRYGGTSGGGTGGGLPSIFSRIHLPRDTGDVRVATDVTVSMLPWPSSPRRASF